MNKTLPQIKHVVVVMLENRSLDNLLGWLYEAPDNLPAHNVPVNPHPYYDGLVPGKFSQQFSNNEDQVSDFNKLRSDQCANDTPRAGNLPIVLGASGKNIPRVDPFEPYLAVNQQLYWPDAKCPAYQPTCCQEPTMSGFLANYRRHKDVRSDEQAKEILQTYAPGQLPVISTLAKSYAVSDRWFSSVPSQTYCNRGFVGAGTSCGQTDNDLFKPFDAPTIWNILGDHGVSWKIYYHDGLLGGYCLTRHLFSPLHDLPDEHFQDIERFYRDAEKGCLPAYSFVEPAWNFTFWDWDVINGNSYHPPAHLTHGEEFLHKIFGKITQGAWTETLLVVLFDEHGGTYDHVAPACPALAPWDAPGYAKPAQLEHGFDFRRYGVRVPAILISPWIEERTVFRSDRKTANGAELPYDHTSLLATLLRWQGIPKKPQGGADTWGLGARTDQAPTFEAVLNREAPRSDLPVIPCGGFGADTGVAESPALAVVQARSEPLTEFQRSLFGLVVRNMSGGRLGVEHPENRKYVDEMLATLETQGELFDYAKSLRGRLCP